MNICYLRGKCTENEREREREREREILIMKRKQENYIQENPIC